MTAHFLSGRFRAPLLGLTALACATACGGTPKKVTKKPKDKIVIKKSDKPKSEADFANERGKAIGTEQ
jgi:hypothetical protein